ncbi:RNA pseudouridine synthase [Aureibaculum sp. A20]|uniref:RNA pseudouridine synthase n=1 Tax=Aureibaculum flavum TaxID=2795986 RepID=A0ABS0WP08_9FLAO|nr:RNA pseudouridine synthase [Aureibaculum flavum]MBJ2173693.1 RNA pseudouridine synthase [Aureibaculum flavum]
MKSTKDNLQVLHEDNHIIIVNKRVGDIIQGDKTGDTPLSEIVKQYIAIKYQKKGNVFLGVVHRLDRPTSGIVIFARTSKALERLNKMLRDKEIKKTYWAIVKNKPEKEKDTLIHYLKKNPKNNKSTTFPKPTPEAKKAILHYQLIKTLDNYFLLKVDLETGRHHQIRAQLAAIKSPIKGDLKYGAKRSNPDGGISLHAKAIAFRHPVSKELISIISETPNEPVWNSCS